MIVNPVYVHVLVGDPWLFPISEPVHQVHDELRCSIVCHSVRDGWVDSHVEREIPGLGRYGRIGFVRFKDPVNPCRCRAVNAAP